MTSSLAHIVQEPPVAPGVSAQVEAARYALLRRLAPSMRHHLVVNLQPIGMIYEVLDRRLRAPEPNLSDVHESAQKINGFARAALSSCLDVVTWLSPEEDALTEVTEAVRECLGLLTTSFTFRGYSVRNEVPSLPGQIRRPAIRNVLTAAMIHITDETPSPATLVLSGEAGPDSVRLVLTLGPSNGEQGFPAEISYRRISWSDVQALAEAESIKVSRDGRQRIEIAIPWAGASRG